MKARFLPDRRIQLDNGQVIKPGDAGYPAVRDFLNGKQDSFSDALRTYRTPNGSLVRQNLASGAVMFAEDPPAPAKRQIALRGRAGIDAMTLLQHAKQQGIDVFNSITRKALTRWLQQRPDALLRATRLFNTSELQSLQNQLAAVLASGHLLGRATIRERINQRTPSNTQPSLQMFADEGGIRPLVPQEALAFFRRLIPGLGTAGDSYLGEPLERRAFTLAASSDGEILRRVQDALARAMESGKSIRNTSRDVDAILDAAGVSPRRPGYSEMVSRTNLLSSMNEGAQLEFDDEDIAHYFPAWRFIGVKDGRQREAHEQHFGKIFPRGVKFADVRGPSIYNCRCGFAPLTAADIKGQRIERFAESWREEQHPRDEGGRFGSVGKEPDKFSEHVCYCDCSTRQCERRQNGHCSSGCACGSCLDDNWRRAAEKLKARCNS